MLNQRAVDPGETALRQDDARHSIEVLHAIQRMANQLGQFRFTLAPNDQPKLMLAGVEISVRADLLAHGTARGQDQIGVAILRMTQDDADSDAARSKRRDMGHYVASLARIHAERNLAGGQAVANRLCMSIDVQHGEVFQAPASNVRRMNDIENACRFIAATWDLI